MDAPRSVPGIVALYSRDLTIQWAANMAGFGLVIAAGMYWVSLPVSPDPPPVDNSFDVALAQCASIGGLILAGIGLLLVLRRWRRVSRILAEGIIIKGLVEDLEVVSTTWTDKDSVTRAKHTRRSYYAVIRYNALEEERTVRVKLPNSGFTFGLVKGQETELVLNEWLPNEPLIKAIYL